MELKVVDDTIAVLNMVLSEQARGTLETKLISELLEKLKGVDMTPVTPDVATAEFVVAGTPRGDLKTQLQDLLKKKLGREIAVTIHVDPKIISGGILKFGSLNLDGSLQNQIIEAGSALKGKIENGQIGPS
jgi:F0F1-type ATP synthase delta subunit